MQRCVFAVFALKTVIRRCAERSTLRVNERCVMNVFLKTFLFTELSVDYIK